MYLDEKVNHQLILKCLDKSHKLEKVSEVVGSQVTDVNKKTCDYCGNQVLNEMLS